MKVSAIIVTYQAEALIDGCLTSLNQACSKLDTFVIDNNSNDGTIEIIARHPGVAVYQAGENHGFAKAMNFGITKALEGGADAVLLINQDLILEAGSVDLLVEDLNSNDRVDIFSPTHFSASEACLDENFKGYLCKNTGHFVEDAAKQNMKDIYKTVFVNAACWLVRRRCFEEVGGFDPIFFMYGEDKDFCNRVNARGRDIAIDLRARCFHLRSSHSAKLSWRKTIARESNFILSSWILHMKNPDRSYIRKFISLLIDFLIRVLQRIQARSPLLLAALPVALIRLIVNLPRIVLHTRKSAKAGAFFDGKLDYGYERIQ